VNDGPRGKRLWPGVLVGVCVISVTAVLIYLLKDMLGAKVEAPKKVVQEVRIVRPPPPPPETEPPPPPPPEEKVDLPDPQQQPDPTPSNEPPPGEQLGVDAVGAGSGDGFGLVGRPGGRDLLATGGGSAYAWYAGIIKSEILDRLADEKKVRSGSYTVAVRLWVRRDGSVERASLVGSSGDKERDRTIETTLSQLSRLSQPPPADMPQPITLRIVSRP
jgi:periplasmic protein TonB